MVKLQEKSLDRTFAALSDPTRRALLARLGNRESLSVSELAQPFSMSLPAIMKHLDVLSDAGLIARELNLELYQVDLSRIVSKWVGETETRPSTDATFGGITIPLHELACYVDVTVRLLEDSAITIETLLAILLGEAFAGAEGQAFLTGSGSKRPLGALMSRFKVRRHECSSPDRFGSEASARRSRMAGGGS